MHHSPRPMMDTGAAGQGRIKMVSEPVDPELEAKEDHNSSFCGSRHRSPGDRAASPHEQKHRSIEGKFLQHKILDRMIDKLDRMNDEMDRVLEEMARSRRKPEISSISMGFSSVSVPYPPDPYGYSSPPQQYETPSYSPLPPPSPPDYSQPTPPPPDYYGYPQTPLSQPYQYLQQSYQYQYQYSQQQYPMPSPPTVPDYGYPLVMTTPFSAQYAAQSSLSTWNYQQDTAHSPLSIHSLLYSQCQYQSDLLRPYSELEVLNEMPVKEEARESLNCEVLLFDEMNEKDSKTSDDALVTTTVVEPIDVVVIGSTTSECLSVENEVAEKTNVESVTPTDERSVQLENEATYVGEDTASVSTEKGVGSKDGALCEYPKELVKEVTRPIDGEQSELRYESDGTTDQSEPKPFNSSQLDEPISTGFVCKDAKLKTIDCELQIEVSVQIVATDKGVADHVEGKVVVSYHVADFSCCLVTGEYDWTANTERIMKAQVLRDSNMADYMTSKKTMEVNPENSIMDELRKRVDAVKNDKSVKDLVVLLFETVLLTFGFNLDDPNTFGNWMLKWGLSIDEDDTPKELFAIDSSDMSASLEKKLELIEFMAFSTRYKVSVLQSQTADRIWDPGSNKMALQVVCGTGLKFSRDHVCPVDELSFDFGSSWLSGSPESLTSLEVPNFANINLDVNFDALERLVARCKSLKVLKVNKNVSLEQLQVLLVRVPQFAEIGTGTGSFIKDHMVSVLYSACSHFSFLNLGYVPMQSTEPAKFLSHGPLLRRLWVLDKVEEKGLKAMGFSCPLLEELQIFPANPFDDEVLDGEDNGVTEIGFVAISEADDGHWCGWTGSYHSSSFFSPSGSPLQRSNSRNSESTAVTKVAVSSEYGQDEGEASFSPDLKLFVGNLPFDVDSSELAGLFERAGNVEMVEVIYDKVTGRSRGFGFVTMSTVEEVEAAVQQFNGYELKGRAMRVNSGPPPRREELPSRGFRSGGGGGGNFDSANRVYVGNLSWGVDNLALETLFSEQGKVMDARVVYDRDTGRSRGFGFVTLSSAEEVNNAISSLDGCEYTCFTSRSKTAKT